MRATFDLSDSEIEIGLGIHGEPGVSRSKIKSADEIVDAMMDRIISDQPLLSGDEVVLLINDLGSMTNIEIFIINRRVSKILRQKNIQIAKTLTGKYCTSMNMKGFSISLLKLDSELKKFFFMPCESLALSM